MASKIVQMDLTNRIAVEGLEHHQPLHDVPQQLGMISSIPAQTSFPFRVRDPRTARAVFKTLNPRF